jgi:hypothetical protein
MAAKSAMAQTKKDIRNQIATAKPLESSRRLDL